MFPHAERALAYIFSDPWRWDVSRKLVKRAYTIDTWDFDYTAGRHPWLNFQITDDTFWGIMHGDNSGYYEACMRLAALLDHVRQENVRATGGDSLPVCAGGQMLSATTDDFIRIMCQLCR